MNEEIDIRVIMEPEKYGYIECNHCNGYGSSLKEDADCCTKCGGIGIVKGGTGK